MTWNNLCCVPCLKGRSKKMLSVLLPGLVTQNFPRVVFLQYIRAQVESRCKYSKETTN